LLDFWAFVSYLINGCLFVSNFVRASARLLLGSNSSLAAARSLEASAAHHENGKLVFEHGHLIGCRGDDVTQNHTARLLVQDINNLEGGSQEPRGRNWPQNLHVLLAVQDLNRTTHAVKSLEQDVAICLIREHHLQYKYKPIAATLT
jgi:hypothetical protein